MTVVSDTLLNYFHDYQAQYVNLSYTHTFAVKHYDKRAGRMERGEEER